MAIRRQVGKVFLVTVQRGKGALQKGNGDRRAHVHARVEQLCGQRRAALGNLVEARARPIESLVDCRRFTAPQPAHCTGIAVGMGNLFGNSETRRSSFFRRVLHVPPFAVDHRVDQTVDFYLVLQCTLLAKSIISNLFGLLEKALRTGKVS
ncbi:hypothetical protein GCM10022276_15770 [Sphingomonas limnosediminicola]|uniref:Transposase n=1 Tax=Sphingomonas limnosediminicola TaxID=940133 RepID=A0ABP7LDT4_9SPHN